MMSFLRSCFVHPRPRALLPLQNYLKMSDDPRTERIIAFCGVQDLNEQRRIIDCTPDYDIHKPAFLIILAMTLRSQMVDVRDLAAAIASCRLAVELSKNVPTLLVLALRELAVSSFARFELSGASPDLQVADLNAATVSCRRVLELMADDDPRLLQSVHEYADCFVRRLRVRNDIDTLREACTWLRCVVELLPDTHEAKPEILHCLGRLLIAYCVRHHGSVDDIHEAIVVLVHAVELASSSSPERSAYVDSLTTALTRRYKMEDMDDLSPLAQYHSVVDILPQEHALKFLPLLAMSFRARFKRSVSQDDQVQATIDIDTDIELQRRILERIMHAGPSHARRTVLGVLATIKSDYVDFLAFTLLLRLQSWHNPASLSRHVSAVDLIPDDHPEKPLLLTRLADNFRARFERDRDRDLNDIVASVTAARHALRLEPDSFSALRCLGCAIVARFCHDKKSYSPTDDLDEAIPLLQRAVGILLASNEVDMHVFVALAEALMMRFMRLGDPAVSDIEYAISLLQRAIDQLPDSHIEKPTYLAELAIVLSARYLHARKIRDIEHAVQVMRRAIELLPNSDSRRPHLLADLGSLFEYRSDYVGNYEDTERAVEAYREAASASHSERDRVWNLLQLSLALGRRSLYRDAPESGLDEAVNVLRGVDRAPLDPVTEQQYLAFLGYALIARYRRHGVRDDLNEATEVSERALTLSADLVGSSDSHRSGVMCASASLGLCYLCRFDIAQHAQDLDKGFAYLRRVYDSIPPGYITSDVLYPWVEKLIARLGVYIFPRVDHLREARDQAHRAVAAGGGPSTVLDSTLQFTSLVKWADLLPQDERQRLLEDVTAMYGRIMPLISQAAWLGDDIDRRFDRLSEYSEQNIVGAAVAHALRMDDVTSALEWFEQGRAVVWTQINRLRTPVDELRTEHPDLADRLERTAQALENAGRRSASSHGRTPGDQSVAARHGDDGLRATLLDVRSAMFAEDGEHRSRSMRRYKADEHRRLAEDYRELLDEIRRIPGFKNFLSPRTRDELSLAAVHGPVACINMHKSRCDALVLCGSELHHVPLPNLTPAIAEEWQKTLYKCLGRDFARDRKSKPVITASNDGIVGVLRRIWAVVVRPIFAVLGWTDDLSVHSRRIKWCTGGSIAFLPLHAAGPYYGSLANAFDIAVSSYTPTLAALLLEPNTSTTQPSILVVAQSDAAGGSRLPGTKLECDHIRGHFPETMSKFLIDAEGTATAVLENMSAHPYIHLACHGRQGVADPLNSAFLLHESELTLRELMARPSTVGELAFLSACETSKGHEKMPDEAVHLAAGMLVVGYRSVVGTMWSISDSEAPRVADEFYRTLLESRAEDGQVDAAYALHSATQALRTKVGVHEFATWVPFVHFGL